MAIILLFLISLICYRFGASSDGLLFLETFQEDVFANGRWEKSSSPDFIDQPVEITKAKKPAKGFEEDTALELTKEMKRYAVGAKFASPIDSKDKDLVIQYETKYEEMVTCGGSYIKLLRDVDNFDITKMDSSTPYTIMFGPDKCGHETNKVHFILNYQHPITKEWEEKHFNDTPSIKNDRKSHLYTLHLMSNNSFSIYIDTIQVKSGNLLTHMSPPINPPREIDDPTDSKPESWVDEAKIPDPLASKPQDWDESLPPMIDDESDKKPADWLDDEPLMIPDPKANKPEDWLDEEDGEWEAPSVQNPKCVTASGCGVWSPQQIKNPAYKGKWRAPLIDNPQYIGEWKPRQIPNPNYFYDNQPSSVHPMGGVGVEVWTTNKGYRFDNILISHSLELALKYAENTYIKKQIAEKEMNIDEEREDETTGTLSHYWSILQAHGRNIQKLRDMYPTQCSIAFSIILSSFIVWIFIFGRDFLPKKPKSTVGDIRETNNNNNIETVKTEDNKDNKDNVLVEETKEKEQEKEREEKIKKENEREKDEDIVTNRKKRTPKDT
eukprot:CAMPEP_0182416664 /NCGR_PEP_ID=MMETSP1167-20130531/1043_1 /TAXON_ID=2988 /ORGANISM="Mallomonas Sp, Strain CCMP3275" /LENGTH=551 /DNA_ID=CAMNT_0024589661 /DNA_START=65 /DNA_END=1720 /DNA_ORIENTATION=-